MPFPYDKSLFIFRRDLRLDDNTALLSAQESSRTVIPCFILDPRQISDNPYRSDNSVQFMLESLEDLAGQIRQKGGRFYLLFGRPDKALEKILTRESIQAVFINRDYTPFSIQRDLALKHICEKNGVVFDESDDCLLHEPEAVVKDDGGVYTVFTPFFRKSASLPVRPPRANTLGNFFQGDIPGQVDLAAQNVLGRLNSDLAVRGGRKNALKILASLKEFRNYERARDIPSVKGTTGLSAHLKFGTCSAREVYAAVQEELGEGHPLIRQLYWRDFFTYVGFHCPQVLAGAFVEKYNRIPWENDEKKFRRWRDGLTGFPVVDAGMRELNATGFMHNRVRMITASFLVKDLHVDWRWGEKYFAQKLVDYDPFVNNGNWQWAASTGCDAQPYFRIFNPWLQQERFDKDCRYIKQWVPELKDLRPQDIHRLGKACPSGLRGYPLPLVDHALESRISREMFLAVR